MIIPVLLLLSLGISVIYTSSSSLALQQSSFALVGLSLYFFLSRFDYRILKNLTVFVYVLCILFLVVVFVLGFETRGSIRWIPLGFFNFQPSEFAKISLILLMSDFWSRNSPTFKNILISLLLLLPLVGLIFKQPDLGTTVTVCFIWLIVLIGAKLSLSKFLLLLCLIVFLTPLGWLTLKDYQKQRFLSFLYPTQDPLGVGYNVIQSTIAVGSGEFFGRGLGRGTQSRLQFLPEFRTDFIFAFIAEELGFVGSLVVLFLYSVLFYDLFKSLKRVKDKFGELIILGVLGMLFFQVVVNIGMNIGIMPITGITLPLLSYGGSSIIITLFSLGIIESINKYGLKEPYIDTLEIRG